MYVPSVEDEAIRDVCRARDATRVTLKAAKLRLKSFLLRLGFNYVGRADWNDGSSPLSRPNRLPDPGAADRLPGIASRRRRAGRAARRVWSRSCSSSRRSGACIRSLKRLQALRGVQWLVALTVVAELGDLTRFDNPRPARRVRRIDAVGAHQRRQAQTGRHHQDRQWSGAPRVDRRRVGLSLSREDLRAHPTPHRQAPQDRAGHRMEGAGATLQALPPARSPAASTPTSSPRRSRGSCLRSCGRSPRR